MVVFGIRFVGINPENGWKVLFSLGLIAVVIILRRTLRGTLRLLARGDSEAVRVRFWTHQSITIFTAILIVIGLVSIWFDDPTRLATALGLISAGLAFALQKVITSLAGYFVLLRGNTFTVGDRIMMGGVRGDVVALGFIQTTIMEMGQPPPVQMDEPAMWVQSRQFTGRIVTVSNSRIFDEPVYNYTRDFSYIWEEIHIPITYKADRDAAEKIMLTVAREFALTEEKIGPTATRRLHDRYQVQPFDLEPSVFYRLTDNWLELTLRFVTEVHGTRQVKDKISREIVSQFDAAEIGIASATYDIVSLPPIELKND